MRTSASGLQYPNPYYWNKTYNIYGDIANGLADCTCYVYGAIIEEGHKPPLSTTRNANTFHLSLINGWNYRIPFDKNKLEPGDIIQWVAKCHVAIYTGSGNISGSFYTGMHGRAYWNGKFDIRTFSSLQEMSDWMVTNYPTRFFHNWPIETENSWVGGAPEYIIKHPLWSVPENKKVDQIYVSGYDMNVRNSNNEVLKLAEKGYFNVLGWKDSNGYRWYEVEPGKYIANVSSRVTYIPKESSEIEALRAENEELKSRISKIHALSEI